MEHLTTEVRWALGGIFLLLILSSLYVFILCRFQPDKNRVELVQRMKTWWIIIVVFGCAFLLGKTALLFFFAFVSFLGMKEYFSLIPARRADRRVLFWAYLAIPVQYYWVYVDWYGMFIVFIPVYMFMLIPSRMILTGVTEGFLRSIGMVQWGLMTTVFSLSHAAALISLEWNSNARTVPDANDTIGEVSPGPGLLILLIALTQMNDVAQYVWGKTCGHRKIAPHISPGKTVAGFVGGVATTAIIACIVGPWLTLLNWQYALVAGLLIGVGGFFGDLSISALKRDLGVKDTSAMLPGHGGVMDRVDSLTFTAPLFFHYVYYLYF
ncbi:Phosphatidate cytidylyltransferase [Polystyrenella longa]|uniref:Phosphatidate cytidylyltransferase n=1 Tax=Polystyrenella longa TaxID=2528007 RepID=A0A518CRM1_9PLAN|nr:phosphatidate cytidylyltransferase [Polystyrenella longa]QDU81860.1 Phosphatidate cytidylyltransferase [Polystyrenella longa]